MPPEIEITDSQDEQALANFFRDADQVYIPVFQRPYVWKRKEFEDLCADITLIKEEIENSQFLGAVLTFSPPRQNEVAGRMVSLSLVDGQQRIMTLYTFIASLVEFLIPLDHEEALANSRDYLFCQPRRGLQVSTRLIPSSKDRNQFKRILNNVFRTEAIQNQLEAELAMLPASSGSSDGSLYKQYRRIFNFIKKGLPSDSNEKINYLKNLITIITTKLTFVHLLLKDASCASKIFERLNYRGVKVGIVDLIRNEVFSRTDDDENANRIFRDKWQPFEDRFDNNSEGFFFPYCLLTNSNAKKSEIFQELRKKWGEGDPNEVINHMSPYQNAYLAVDGTMRFEQSQNISDTIKRLVRMKRPSVCYPYLMGLLIQYMNDEISEDNCVSAITSVETFLVRRSIVGYEPTGLHALFKGLIHQIENYTLSGLQNIVTERGTIQWASDEDIIDAIKIRKFDKSKIRDFILTEYDRSLPGDDPDEKPTVEHILPQNYNADWHQSFTLEEHKEFHKTLANLIPLSQPLNSSVQDKAYSKKQPRYSEESMFKTPRYISNHYNEWNLDTLNERCTDLTNWVLQKWPDSN
jgi:hypothetical protein